MSGKCAGGCCAMFWLPKTIPAGVTDGDFIRDMRVELTVEQARERWATFVGGEPPVGAFDTEINPDQGLYTCRHWDEATRLCTVYEQRPRLCRDYPYGAQCHHGCDFQIEDQTALDRYAVTRD